MKPLSLQQTLQLALDTCNRLITDDLGMEEARRQAVIKLGMSAANNLVEMGSEGSMIAVQIWCALAREWISEDAVHQSMELDFARVGMRLNEVRAYVPNLKVATVPMPPVTDPQEIDLPPQRPSETAVWDIEARRWVEPQS